MKILHYSLGLPPYRSGGLTKYCMDLILNQHKNGDDTYLLFPGKFSLLKKDTYIKYYKYYKGIEVYELINPLPVPILNGVLEPERYMKMCDEYVFMDFLRKLSPDIVHIHTFMGLPKEFLLICKKLNIRVVFTTHDYYGLCTKVNFVDYEGKVCKTRDIDKCLKCNLSGLSINKIKILQSTPYRLVKNIGIIDKIKILNQKMKRKSSLISNKSINKFYSIDKKKYEKLLIYYEEMYGLINYFLFNSTVTKDMYNKFLSTKGRIISISHEDIIDKRTSRDYNRKQLRLTYLGPTKEYKGFFLLVEVMKQLKKEDYNDIILNVYGNITINSLQIPSNITLHGIYKYTDLEKIFFISDVLIVPSIWYETFGFSTLEAISYGVPVIVTERVGSKDILKNEKYGFIVKCDLANIKKSIIDIYENRDLLIEKHNNIINDNLDSFNEHINDIYKYAYNSKLT